MKKGNINKGNSKPPRFNPKVSAAPIAPKKLRAGVPMRADSVRIPNWLGDKFINNPSIGAISARGTATVSQWARAFATTMSSNGISLCVMSSNVPSS